MTALLLVPFVICGLVGSGPAICTFRLATGVGCPGCGLTRSVCAFVHGRFGDALSLHLFGPLLYLTVVAAWLFMAAGLIRGADPFQVRFEHFSKCMIGVVIGMVAYWVVRLILGIVP